MADYFAGWPTVKESLDDAIRERFINWEDETIPKYESVGIYWEYKPPKKWEYDYKDYWERGDISESIKQKENIDLSNIIDEPYFPIIQRLYKSWAISDETLKLLNDGFQEKDKNINIESLGLLINWENKQINNEIQLIIDTIKKLEENKEGNIKAFKKELGIEEKLKKSDHPAFEEEVYDMIWGNYLSADNSDSNRWNKENEINLNYSMAIWITANKIIKNSTNLARIKDSISYKNAIRDIRESENIDRQLKWLQSLYLLSWQIEWAFWKGDKEKSKIMQQWIELKKEDLIARFNELKILLAEAENGMNQSKIIKLNEEIADVVEEAQEIDDWEIFAWSELDNLYDWLDNRFKENPTYYS